MSEKSTQPSQQRGWRWKRTAATALLLLVGGAIVNVAVAWGCAIRVIGTTRALHLGRSHDLPGVAEWQVNTVVGLGSTHVLSQAFGTRFDEPEIESPYRMPAEDALPWWCPWLRPTELLVEPQWFSQTALAHGLPMRSMLVMHDEQCEEQSRGLRPWSVQGIPQWVRGRTTRGMWPTGPVEFPLQPILPGFIINTVFYALFLWLLFFAPFAVRRMLRRRRGQCEKCAYPIGVNSVCTECGAAVSRNEPRARQNEPRA